jgi:toxin-antitoxin system PIN domain toxin
MSATLDVNVLLYASNKSSEHYEKARGFVESLMAGPELTYVFWPVIMAYQRISAHPSIFDNPLSFSEATENISSLLARPPIRTVGEQGEFWVTYRRATEQVRPRGNLVPDSHIVALMHQNGIKTIWTNDSDFKRFTGIKPKNPFQ